MSKDDLSWVEPGHRVVHTATILREGWEMDNRLWVVEGDGVTTNHMRRCYLEDGELDGLIAEHRAALTSLERARELLGVRGDAD